MPPGDLKMYLHILYHGRYPQVSFLIYQLPLYEHLSRQDAVQVLEDVKNGYLRCGDNVTVYGQDDDMRLSITEKDKSDEITYAIVKNK